MLLDFKLKCYKTTWDQQIDMGQNGTPKLNCTEIFNSIGQTETGYETVFITLPWIFHLQTQA